MGRIEKTVFISYRRTNLPWALNIYQDLTHHGYDVFFDYQSINSGDFERVILDNIRARAHFIVILTPSALERCKEPNDWLRREIETAIDEKRNIVPLMMEGFDFGSPAIIQTLTGKLASLSNKNGLPIYAAYFFEGMEKLRNRYLDVALDDVPLRSLSPEVKEMTDAQKAAASEAAPVEKEQLTAQEWYERGFVFRNAKNFEEAFRCFTEAISLKPDISIFFAARGKARRDMGDLNGAIDDLAEAVRLESASSTLLYDLGTVREANGDLLGALHNYLELIRFYPKMSAARTSLMGVFRKLGRKSEADEQEALARKFIQHDIEYNQACFEAICGNKDRALALLKTALEIGFPTKEWARQDPDLENLRNDPRFKALVE